MLGITHLIFGFASVYIAGLPVVLGMIGSLAPDIDVLFNFTFPFVHRGIMHTPIFAIALVLIIYALTENKGSSLSFGAGYLAHLFLDTFTYSGIMWLFPLTNESFSFSFFSYANIPGNLLVIALSASLAYLWKNLEVIFGWIRMLKDF